MKRGAAALLCGLALLALPVVSETSSNTPAAVAAPAADTSKSHHDSVLTAGPQAPKDSLPKPKTRADSVTVPKHTFNHRQQIITGSVVMTCLALIMVLMNNYNPR